MRKIKPGDIFDDMIVIEKIDPRKKYSGYRYIVKCLKCGRKKEADRSVLINHTGTKHKSCGQGLKSKDKKFYQTWKGLRQRTTNPNYEHYENYGGRGINSDAFINFIDFYDSMYESYKKAYEEFGNDISIERIDVNGNYEPKNCKWIHKNEQQENTTKNKYFWAVSPDNEIFLIKNQRKFAKEHNLSDKQINACLNKRFKSHFGWTFNYLE